MKPIFEEERQFFYKKTNILLPPYCWRHSNKIYLDPYCEKPIYIQKVDGGELKITKNNIELFKDYKRATLEEVLNKEKDRVQELFDSSVRWVQDYFNREENKNTKIIVAYSGGKDSDVLKRVMDAAHINYILNFANTTNDTADTYTHWNETKATVSHWNCMNPDEGFYAWIKRKKYFIPTALVRNCCSTFKEGQLTKEYNIKEPLFDVVGVRKLESVKRSKYEKIMDHTYRLKFSKDNKDRFPVKWVQIAPILDWSDLDIWVYILNNNIKIHKAYYYGYERCGCLICPYTGAYDDMLTNEYYPFLWKRWTTEILPNSYENLHIKENFKWTLKEWIEGEWKSGVSKEARLIRLNPTKERVEQIMQLKGCTEEIAKKFFKNQCCICGKKLNPNESGMNLKMYGRDMKVDKMQCKKCMCKELGWSLKDFDTKVRSFRDGGCNLF